MEFSNSIRRRFINNIRTIISTNPPAFKNSHFGFVLHIDSDIHCLKQCINLYKELKVNVIGVSISEANQPKYILYLLKKYNPSILVLTGHDSIIAGKISSNNINDYRYSKYYIQSVRIARTYNPDINKLVIIAGGCQSYYEQLIKSGANFASSPDRLSIHITDPVYIAYKIYTTSNNDLITIDSLYNDFSFPNGSFGGVSTYGQCIYN